MSVPLLVVLPFHRGDRDLALNLLAWIGELGGCKNNQCLLVADGKMTKEEVNPVIESAKKVFRTVTITAPQIVLKDEKWPIGANWMFETAARHIAKTHKTPWLWLEPDAVPMKTGWLSEIEQSYRKCGKQFMGQVFRPNKQGLPPVMMYGIGVYPAELPKGMFQHLVGRRNIPWDISCADIVAPLAGNSILFWNFHNRDMHPTWVRKKEPGHPINAIEVKSIPGHVCIAHTNKDGTLITALRGDDEATIPQIIMAYKEAKNVKVGAPTFNFQASKQLRYVHCVERHVQRDADSEKRVNRAFDSWVALYKTGRVIPAHVWDYPRHAGQIGDSRHLPYLKDILVEGMTKAAPDDVIMLTNDDSILHPKIIEALDEKLKKVDACGSFRVNIREDELDLLKKEPQEIAKTGRHDLGRDLFCFKKKWLKDHWLSIPDFLLAELEWDLVISAMIRRSAGIFTDRRNRNDPMPACEIDRGYLIHVFHERAWTTPQHKTSPAKMHNRKLAIQFYSSNGFPSLISPV